jgi:hypothetical protein
MGLMEPVILIDLFNFIKWRKNLSWQKSLFVIVVVHIFLVNLAFFSIKYTVAGSNTSEISGVFYVFIALLLIECGIMGFALFRMKKQKKVPDSL